MLYSGWLSSLSVLLFLWTILISRKIIPACYNLKKSKYHSFSFKDGTSFMIWVMLKCVTEHLKTLLTLFMYSSIIFKEYLLELKMISKTYFYYYAEQIFILIMTYILPILPSHSWLHKSLMRRKGAFSPTMNIMWLFIKIYSPFIQGSMTGWK